MSNDSDPTDIDEAEFLDGGGPAVRLPDDGVDWVPPRERNGPSETTSRFRVLDNEGKPVSGVPVRVDVETADGETKSVQTTPGPTGYALADLRAVDGEVETVSVEPVSGGARTTLDPEVLDGNAPGVLRLGETRDAFDISEAAMEGLQNQIFTTPPEFADIMAAPELFNPKVIKENGNCSMDFTAKVDVHENYFNQLVRVPQTDRDIQSELSFQELSGIGTEPLNKQVPFDLTTDYPDDESEDGESQPYLDYASKPSLGVLNVYKQSWTRVGHSPGKLLHSLTLAPCESTKVSIIEWSRTERGRRQERSTAREQKQHELHRDRMIEEIVEGMVKEDQWGSSFSVQAGVGSSSGVAASAGSALGAVGRSIAGGAAYSSSNSHGRRELEASTVHRLSDSVVQSASNIRSLRSTVVTQSQQTERDEVRTRAVENHNRNHAMSVEYFQVLEHYNVHTDLVPRLRKEVLMIPYNIPLALWEDPPAFDDFVIDDVEWSMMVATVAEQVADDFSSYLSELGENEIAENQLDAVEDDILMTMVENAVLKAGERIISEGSDVDVLNDNPTKFATEAWTQLKNNIQNFQDFLGNAPPTPIEIKREHFQHGGFLRTMIQVSGEVFEREDPLKESDLLAWLDRYAESLREMVPAEHEAAFDALYRLVHTPEVYETSMPTVTASNWTVELREAWRPGLTVMIHTSDGQTVTLDRESGTEGSAVASFSSPAVDVEAIDAIEINFAPETASKSIIESVAETVDDFGDVTEELGEFLTGQNDAPLTEELEKSREFELDRVRVTAHSDPTDVLPRSESYQLLDETNVNQTLTANNPATRWDTIKQPQPDILETETRRYDDYQTVEKLVNHIQANRMAYLRRLWLSEDPDRRALRFQRYRYEIERNEESEEVPLLDLIENEPVGVLGNSVAFPLLDQNQFDERVEGAEDPVEDKMVSLPTKGVYAETLLSHCNATEIRDLDRVVDETNACRTDAPDIEGVSPGSRRSEVDTQPVGPPQSSVNIQQAPDAPAPTGLQGALQTLSQPNIFRDMSLGNETVNAANSLAEKALNESGQARQQTLEALSSMLESTGGDGSVAGSDGSGTSNVGDASRSARRTAFNAARDKIQNAANEAHRRSDPITQRDHQRALNKSKEEGALSEEAHSRASERLNNADEQASANDEQGTQTTPSAESTSEKLDEHTYKVQLLLDGFPVEGSELADEHIRALEYLVATKEAGMQVIVEKIEGRASQTGPDDLNEQLSRDRAERVAQYLIRNGFSPDMEVVHYGDDKPLVDSPDEELDVNRSVVVTYLARDPLPEPQQPEPQQPTSDGHCPGSTAYEWEIMLPAAMNAHAILGGIVAAGKLRKANDPSEERNIFFIGAGAGVSLSSKLDEADDIWKILRELRDSFGGSIGGTWAEFTTGRVCYDFDDFDNAYGRLTMGEAGLGVGVSTAFLTWPMLTGASINLSGLNWGPVGAEANTNAGIWLVEDQDDA